jgi:DNA-binding transcriptional ArsR family regulator
MDMNLDEQRRHLRRMSKLLFGNADRLEVAAALADPERHVVSASELAFDLKIAPSRVWTQLRTFAEAGLLEAMPRTGNTVYYIRRDSPFWTLALTLVREATREASP